MLGDLNKECIVFRKIGIVGLLVLAACTAREGKVDRWMADDGRVKVLSTVGMIDDLVRSVGGEEVDRLVLIGGALDPHSYELVKGDDEKLARADIVFYNGLGLEHGPSLARFLRESDRAVGVGDAIVRQRPDAVVRVDGQVDPHIWMDVSLWLQGVDVVVAELASADPEHAEQFERRGAHLKRRLRDLDTQVMAALAKVPSEKRYVVTSHDSCNYFTRRYLATPQERMSGRWQERCCSPEGLAPDAQLSTTDIQEVVNHLVAYNIRVLFPESNLSQDSIRKLVDAGRHKGLEIRVAAEPLYGDAMGEPGSDGDTYEKMMWHNARVLMENLNAQAEAA
jgi:manganese/zinc/iron transport system substrate-binding protein